MPKKIRKSTLQARDDHAKKIKEYSKKIRRTLAKLSLAQTDRNALLALLGTSGRAERPLASDRRVVKRAALILARNMRKEFPENPARRFFHVTLIDDVGTTSDREPVAYLDFLEDKTRRALVSVGLDAVVVLEMHPLMNYPAGGQGRSLLYHAHAIAWSDKPFDPGAAEERLNGSRAWHCSLGAQPVKIAPITNTVRDINQVALYLVKPSHSVKNRMPDQKRPGRFILMDTTKGYRNDMALRVFEGLSQVDLTSMIFGVGAGKAVRQRIRSELENWQRSRSTEGTFIPASYNVWAMWHRLRKTFGSTNYLPYRFDRLPPPAKPLRLTNPVKSSRPKVSRPHSRSAMEARRRRERLVVGLRSRTSAGRPGRNHIAD